MKKLILLLVVLLPLSRASGQTYNITNGDLDNCPINQTINGCPSWYYNLATNTSYFNNWIVTHGTPNCNGGSVFMFARKCNNTGVLEGEGMAGGYHFEAGDKYYVDVQFNEFSKQAPGDFFAVSAANNLPIIPNSPLPSGCIACASPIPTGQDASTIGLVTNSLTNALVEFPEFKPTKDFWELWLFPVGGSTSDQTNSSVDFIRITKCLSGCQQIVSPGGATILGCNVQSVNQIPTGLTNRERIVAGSMQPYTSVVLTNDPYSKTKFIGRSIELRENTDITAAHPPGEIVTDAGVFIAEAVWACRQVADDGGGGDGGGGDGDAGKSPQGYENMISSINAGYIASGTAPNTNDSASIANESSMGMLHTLRVYPNPATDKLSIEMPEPREYHVTLLNVLGSVVYTEDVKSETSHTIELNKSLPAGVYSIQLKGKNLNHTERISIIR